MARPDQIKEELARWRLCFGLPVVIAIVAVLAVLVYLAMMKKTDELGGLE